MKSKIREGLKNGIITYKNYTVKFGEYTIGGIDAENEDDLVDQIEKTLYRHDFGGMRFFLEERGKQYDYMENYIF